METGKTSREGYSDSWGSKSLPLQPAAAASGANSEGSISDSKYLLGEQEGEVNIDEFNFTDKNAILNMSENQLKRFTDSPAFKLWAMNEGPKMKRP